MHFFLLSMTLKAMNFYLHCVVLPHPATIKASEMDVGAVNACSGIQIGRIKSVYGGVSFKITKAMSSSCL